MLYFAASSFPVSPFFLNENTVSKKVRKVLRKEKIGPESGLSFLSFLGER